MSCVIPLNSILCCFRNGITQLFEVDSICSFRAFCNTGNLQSRAIFAAEFHTIFAKGKGVVHISYITIRCIGIYMFIREGNSVAILFQERLVPFNNGIAIFAISIAIIAGINAAIIHGEPLLSGQFARHIEVAPYSRLSCANGETGCIVIRADINAVSVKLNTIAVQLAAFLLPSVWIGDGGGAKDASINESYAIEVAVLVIEEDFHIVAVRTHGGIAFSDHDVIEAAMAVLVNVERIACTIDFRNVPQCCPISTAEGDRIFGFAVILHSQFIQSFHFGVYLVELRLIDCIIIIDTICYIYNFTGLIFGADRYDIVFAGYAVRADGYGVDAINLSIVADSGAEVGFYICSAADGNAVLAVYKGAVTKNYVVLAIISAGYHACCFVCSEDVCIGLRFGVYIRELLEIDSVCILRASRYIDNSPFTACVTYRNGIGFISNTASSQCDGSFCLCVCIIAKCCSFLRQSMSIHANRCSAGTTSDSILTEDYVSAGESLAADSDGIVAGDFALFANSNGILRSVTRFCFNRARYDACGIKLACGDCVTTVLCECAVCYVGDFAEIVISVSFSVHIQVTFFMTYGNTGITLSHTVSTKCYSTILQCSCTVSNGCGLIGRATSIGRCADGNRTSNLGICFVSKRYRIARCAGLDISLPILINANHAGILCGFRCDFKILQREISLEVAFFIDEVEFLCSHVAFDFYIIGVLFSGIIIGIFNYACFGTGQFLDLANCGSVAVIDAVCHIDDTTGKGGMIFIKEITLLSLEQRFPLFCSCFRCPNRNDTVAQIFIPVIKIFSGNNAISAQCYTPSAVNDGRLTTKCQATICVVSSRNYTGHIADSNAFICSFYIGQVRTNSNASLTISYIDIIISHGKGSVILGSTSAILRSRFNASFFHRFHFCL